MLLAEEVEAAVAAARLGRLEIAEVRRRTRITRMHVEWQRVRARRQIAAVETTMQALSETLATLGIRPVKLEWSPARDALDDVLYPLD